MAAWIKMPLGMELGLSPCDFVLDGDPALPSPNKAAEPPAQFSTHFCCGQTAACINMPLGMKVGLSPGDFVLDGDPAPLSFRTMFIIVIVISLDPCTMHSRYWFIQVSVQVLVFYAFYFLEKSLSLIVLSLFQYKYGMHSCTT